MKTKHEMDPAAAFPDAGNEPDDAALKAALGRAAVPIEKMRTAVRAAQPAATFEWKFSERSGWHQIYGLKKRRLLYLIPKRGDFRVSLILGGKALADLQAGPFAAAITELLKTAPRYPEGTGFSFDRQSFDADLMAALLAAKIAH